MCNVDLERCVEFGTLAEQEDEAFYDDRSEADNDLEKGRIKFPRNILYGRDEELQILEQAFSSDGDFCRVVFVGGYSGTGKSALVDAFAEKVSSKRTSFPSFMSGKYSQIRAGYPFSAISQAANQYVLQTLQHSKAIDLDELRTRLSGAGITVGGVTTDILTSTLIPGLNELLGKQSSLSKQAVGNGACFGLADIKFACQAFIQAVATEANPLILFIDDLQWADDASLQLLTALLKDKTLKNVFFIGAYRINEINEEHGFSKMMKDVDAAKGGELCKNLELSNLSPDSIAQFIADSIDRKADEVSAVAEAVYTKTLGNIFFVKQALEELVRKNALYYDVLYFQWQFGDVSRVELEQFLSDDVLQMVRSKLGALPKSLQTVLAVQAYAKNALELDLLLAFLNAQSIRLELQSLRKMMNRAFIEGLVLKVDDGRSYKFSHDRIREAACASVPEGDERNKFLVCISMALLELGTLPSNEWMLFAAARHLNSIPPNMFDSTRLIELNLKVGKIAILKGAFNEAVIFLRVADERLDPTNCWLEQYDITLEIKSTLAEVEHTLGNQERSLDISKNIFDKAKSLHDKSRAHCVYIDAMSKNASDYGPSVDAALEILKLYKVDIPREPTAREVKGEKFRLKLALYGRPLARLSKLPVAQEDGLGAIIAKTARLASWAKMPNLVTVLGHKMIRGGLASKMISKDYPYVLIMLASPLREVEKYERAFSFANAAMILMDRFPDETAVEFVKAKMALYATLSAIRIPFRDTIEALLDVNKTLLSKGENEMGFAAGMVAMISYLNASFPIGSLLEPKLVLFQEAASSVGMKPFVVIFGLLRQFLYNLQGGKKASLNPTEIDGAALKEDDIALPGPAMKMIRRDIGIVRLKLAVLFNDEQTMEAMLDRLDEYPIFDMPVARQHLRMTWTGLASLILSKKTDKYSKWAEDTSKFFEKLSKFGSPNAYPVYVSMKALEKNTVAAFDEAINVCGNAGLFNMAGLMNERCGLMLAEKQNKNSEEYLKNAVWFFHDWGATAKVEHMQRQFPFLISAMREKAPSQLSNIRRQANKFGIPNR